MMLSKQAIKEYKEIYKKEYGEELSDEEAIKQGTNLIELVKLITSKK